MEGEEIHRSTGKLTTMGFNAKPVISVEFSNTFATEEPTAYG